MTGFGNVYARPIATFEVKPGEVVDIGMLIVHPGHRVFAATVAPIPAEVLRNYAQNKPELFRRRVSRPMIAAAQVPAPPPQARPKPSPAPARP